MSTLIYLGVLQWLATLAESMINFLKEEYLMCSLGTLRPKRDISFTNLTTNSVFVSRDVRFFETIFPYKVLNITHMSQTEPTNNTPITITPSTECEPETSFSLPNTPEATIPNTTYSPQPIEPTQTPTPTLRKSSRPHQTP